MGDKVKLSPAMQAAMWKIDRDGRTYRCGNPRTIDALIARHGFVAMVPGAGVTPSGLEGGVGLFLTDAGRAWIAEQIEAAHVEALAMNQLGDWRHGSRMQPVARGGAAALAPFGASRFDMDRLEADADEAWEMDRAYMKGLGRECGFEYRVGDDITAERFVRLDANLNLTSQVRRTPAGWEAHRGGIITTFYEDLRGALGHAAWS